MGVVLRTRLLFMHRYRYAEDKVTIIHSQIIHRRINSVSSLGLVSLILYLSQRLHVCQGLCLSFMIMNVRVHQTWKATELLMVTAVPLSHLIFKECFPTVSTTIFVIPNHIICTSTVMYRHCLLLPSLSFPSYTHTAPVYQFPPAHSSTLPNLLSFKLRLLNSAICTHASRCHRWLLLLPYQTLRINTTTNIVATRYP